MKEEKNIKIIIPEGHFEGNCDSCFYANKKSKDAEGRILCKNESGGYNFPHEKNGCQYYKSKIVQWIKIIVFLYLLVAFFAGFIELFLH